MKRRAFSQAASAAALSLANPAAHAALEWLGRSARPPSLSGPAMGTNLSGMEWARPGLRVSQSSLPNLHFTVPRGPNVAWLAACGYAKSRLPIRWEMLQPMLHDVPASPGAIAAIGRPGALHAGYASYITQVLDAHAAAGMKCIIDCHNSCRYQDFIYQPDGTVIGLSTPANPLLRPYTSDKNQTITRIFALAPGATLTQAHFTDFWTRAAALWKSHPGFGGYGLMNEPHDMPRAGETVESTRDEDLSIWPAYAQAGIDAIRAVDPTGVIYVSGNQWNSSMSIGKANPGFPLKGQNLIYEVHMYLDALSNGRVFDYDAEVAKNYSAGLGRRAINVETGVERLKPAVEWARTHGVKLALTEVGMPIDDPRWEEMFRRAVQYAYASGMEVYSWMGGNHWPIRNFPINHVAGWHQNKTLEPAVSGVMKAVAGISQATLFDDGPGDAVAGQPVKITVYARGSLKAPLRLKVAASGGALSKSALVIPAGANGEDSFTFTPAQGAGSAVNTLSYSGAAQVPPARKVYCLPDAPAYASTSLADAAMALLAKYRASKWDLADGYTDYMLGAPARAGQPVRAVSDSGFGSSPGNAMEMLNWINTETSRMGSMSVPVMRESRGKKYSDHSRFETYGFWCKKSSRKPGVQPRPANVVPYNLEDAHFAMAVVSVPGVNNSGTVFQASTAELTVCSELRLANSQPQLRFIDSNGQAVELTSPQRLSAHTPSVLTLTSAPGAQQLRVNSALMASGNARFAPSEFAQLLMGWSFLSYYPRDGFRGHFYAAIAGKGAPTAAELAVLERYLASLAGQSI